MGQNAAAVAQCGRVLDLSHQGLSVCPLDFRLDPRVAEVDLSYNNIVSLPTDQPSVETLKLMWNKLSCVNDQMVHAFVTCPKLTNLDLSRNELSAVNPVVFTIPSLRWISLFQNNLSELSIEQCYIEELDLALNRMTKIPKVGDSILKLSLDFNQISVIDQGLQCLKCLSISGNRIASISESVCFPQLEVLDISKNALTTIPDLSKITPVLTKLDCSRNVVGQIKGLPKTIHKVFAARNQISELPSFEGMNFVTVLDFSHNLLTELRGLPLTLHSLHLSNNLITFIEDCDLPELVSLSLERNKLKAMPVFNGNQCTSLSFYGNQLAAISLELFFGDLCFLDLANNQIEKLPNGLFGLPNLFRLNLSRNKIRYISDKLSNSQVVQLNLSHNPLDHFPEFLPKTLEKLEVAYCGLEVIPDSIMYYNELIDLNASGNNLTAFPVIPELLFVNLSRNNLEKFPYLSHRIQFADLSHNGMAHLHSDFTYPEMTYLDLSCNPIRQLPKVVSLDSLKSLSIRKTKLTGILNFPNLEYVDITGTDVKVGKPDVILVSSVKYRTKSMFVYNKLRNPSRCSYASTIYTRNPVHDIISLNEKAGVYCIANGNDVTANKSITDLIRKLGKKKPDVRKVFAELNPFLCDKTVVTPTCFCCAFVGNMTISSVRYGPVDIYLYDNKGEKIFSMANIHTPLSTSPDYPMGPCNFPDLEPSAAERALRGDIPSNWDDPLVALPSIPVGVTAKWLVMATSICFHVVPQDTIRQILTSPTDMDSMAGHIRNEALASNYTGNISVVVVDIAHESLHP